MAKILQGLGNFRRAKAKVLGCESYFLSQDHMQVMSPHHPYESKVDDPCVFTIRWSASEAIRGLGKAPLLLVYQSYHLLSVRPAPNENLPPL